MAAAPVALDLRLLHGFRFSCRPDCGLCCYARPAVAPAERAGLLEIAPALELAIGDDGFAYLPVRGDGGACVLLERNRCGAHARRPFPCRVFPLLTHVGERVEATAVLACPGVDLGVLDGWRGEDALRLPPPAGLEGELVAVRAEAAPELIAELRSAAAQDRERLRRRLSRDGRWESPDVLREELAERWPDAPSLHGGGAPPPPSESIEELPLFFDAAHGRVALRSSPTGRYELLAVPEDGRPARRLGEYLPPDAPPVVTEGGRRRLAGYLRYVLAREQFLGCVLHELFSGATGTLRERLGEDLAEVAQEVVRRAAVRARLAGGTGARLGAEEIAHGIRAFDAELLDRPTLGRVL
jgi:Fe-S-cluster containining protein